MAKLAEQLLAYRESLQQLIEALDSDAAPEFVLLLSERSKTLFAALSAGMKCCSPKEHAILTPQLAQARRLAAIVATRCEQQRAATAERLSDIQRARQALAAHAGLAAGGSCDIAG